MNRLFDADVLIRKQKQAISRKDLDLPVRKCFYVQNLLKNALVQEHIQLQICKIILLAYIMKSSVKIRQLKCFVFA
ncbi:citrate lyase holo-[acyl-carrier protein] synthase [Lactobacillus sp. R2/2]|nr:citrate lyase holo-[acyl-carrier protein] synthase [Lactobacillus sp. R2/2]